VLRWTSEQTGKERGEEGFCIFFKEKINHLNSNTNLIPSNPKQCISMNAIINSYASLI
jgi:hypothetical protein